jgi:hypothetical protein
MRVKARGGCACAASSPWWRWLNTCTGELGCLGGLTLTDRPSLRVVLWPRPGPGRNSNSPVGPGSYLGVGGQVDAAIEVGPAQHSRAALGPVSKSATPSAASDYRLYSQSENLVT